MSGVAKLKRALAGRRAKSKDHPSSFEVTATGSGSDTEFGNPSVPPSSTVPVPHSSSNVDYTLRSSKHSPASPRLGKLTMQFASHVFSKPRKRTMSEQLQLRSDPNLSLEAMELNDDDDDSPPPPPPPKSKSSHASQLASQSHSLPDPIADIKPALDLVQASRDPVRSLEDERQGDWRSSAISEATIRVATGGTVIDTPPNSNVYRSTLDDTTSQTFLHGAPSPAQASDIPFSIASSELRNGPDTSLTDASYSPVRTESAVRTFKKSITSNKGVGNLLKGMTTSWKSASTTSLSDATSEPHSQSSTQLPPTAFRQPVTGQETAYTRWPAQHPSDSSMPLATHGSTSFGKLRQTATSLTSGIMPASGAILGFGKRTVDRVRFGAGNIGSWTTQQSGTSNSSNSSLTSGSQRPPHRNTNGLTGSWSTNSIGSGSDISESPQSVHKTPGLGVCLRPASGSLAYVFGRELAHVVRDTRASHIGEARSVVNNELYAPLEQRMIPALVLRCAQHLLKWGIQEEGLFRISGRSSHITRLRTEFDGGADWDMSDCGPADLDPHAVASILKTFLRELPEPILTRSLAKLFDAALAAEQSAMAIADATTTGRQVRESQFNRMNPGLPSGPKPKPQMIRPSLVSVGATTLPNGHRAASELLIETLASLVTRLPIENRDLLRTVVELIQATSSRSKFTKMPMHNILLVFCPSMNMSPPLLRILAENDGVWKAPALPDISSRPSSLLSSENSPQKQRSTGLGTGPRAQRIPRRIPIPAPLEDPGPNTSFDDISVHGTAANTISTLRNRSQSASSPAISLENEMKLLRRRSNTISVGFNPVEIEPPGKVSDDNFNKSLDDLLLAAQIALPPFTESELNLSGIDAGGKGESESQTPVASVPTGSGASKLSLRTYSSSSPSSSSSPAFPSQAIEDGKEADSRPVSEPASDSRHENNQPTEVLRLLKAYSESELSSSAQNTLRRRQAPVRHVLSLNLLSTSGIHRDHEDDPPKSAFSLPSPKSFGKSANRRLSILLGSRTRRRSGDLSNLMNMSTMGMDDHVQEELTEDKASHFSPPPKLTLKFENDPSSPLDIRFSGDARKSIELPSLSLPRSSPYRAWSSPLLSENYLASSVPDRMLATSPSHHSLPSTPTLMCFQSAAPLLQLEPSSPAEHDWAQSVLRAAHATSG